MLRKKSHVQLTILVHEVLELGELIVQVGPALDAVLRDDRNSVKESLVITNEILLSHCTEKLHRYGPASST